jgi:hypothetical protein
MFILFETIPPGASPVALPIVVAAGEQADLRQGSLSSGSGWPTSGRRLIQGFPARASNFRGHSGQTSSASPSIKSLIRKVSTGSWQRSAACTIDEDSHRKPTPPTVEVRQNGVARSAAHQGERPLQTLSSVL